MKQFEILEHTADLKIRAFGRTKQELFSNALKGMFGALSPAFGSQPSAVSRKIGLKSTDINALLVDFLSEALYQSNINKEVYDKPEFSKFSDTELEAVIYGQKYEELGEEIKAVTYHGLEIKQGKNGVWEVEVLFDI